jgi:1-phosphofructokinase family hexose kinase
LLLSLCPNPCLDVYYYTGALKEDDTNRVSNPLLSPGGKGVNAARVASRFCSTVFLALPLGGCIGNCVKEFLELEGVSCIVVETASQTRVNTILEQRAKGKHFLIASSGSPLSEEEREKLKRAVCKECSPRVLILGGSVPPGLPQDYYAKIIQEFKGTDTKVIVDADGELLRKAVEAGPYAIKPNKHELERLVGHPLLTVEEVVGAGKELLKYGLEVVIVTLGEYGAIAVTKGGTYKIIPPKVEVKNTVGAGDSVVGGFACKIYLNSPLEEALRFAVACGTATVTQVGTKLCDRESVKEIFKETQILKLN